MNKKQNNHRTHASSKSNRSSGSAPHWTKPVNPLPHYPPSVCFGKNFRRVLASLLLACYTLLIMLTYYTLLTLLTLLYLPELQMSADVK